MRLHRDHSLGKEEARRRVAAVANELCSTYSLNATWNSDDLQITGNGINGCIKVSEQTVDVDVKLGFALSMMSSVIRTSIEDALEKYLA